MCSPSQTCVCLKKHVKAQHFNTRKKKKKSSQKVLRRILKPKGAFQNEMRLMLKLNFYLQRGWSKGGTSTLNLKFGLEIPQKGPAKKTTETTKISSAGFLPMQCFKWIHFHCLWPFPTQFSLWQMQGTNASALCTYREQGSSSVRSDRKTLAKWMKRAPIACLEVS